MNVLATPDWDLGGVVVQLDTYDGVPPHIGQVVSSEGVGGPVYLPWVGDYATDAALWVGAVVATIEQEGVNVYAPGRPLLGV